MIKLDSLDRWQSLAKGDVLTLPGDAPRRVRLNVNSPGVARLFIVTDDGEMRFLAAPERRDVVEFAVGGDVSITTPDEDVAIYTSENEPTFTIIENAEVFTQIANRAARNPDLEHLMYLQEVNMQRRFAAMENSMNQRVQEAYNAGQRTVAHSDAPGAVAPKPVQEPTQSNTDGSAPGADGGTPKPNAPTGDTSGGPVVGNAGDAGQVVLPKPTV